MIEIFKLSSVDEKEFEDIVEQTRTIFYVSSSLKEFSSVESKIAFFKRWCGDYMSLFPDQFFIMKENQKVLGYLSGCNDSKAASALVTVPGFSVFSELFEKYPAHFHINLIPESRGRGLGSKLVEHYCEYLKFLHVKGVHLVTSAGAENISFYQRLNFDHEVQRQFNQMNLLFMGKIVK